MPSSSPLLALITSLTVWSDPPQFLIGRRAVLVKHQPNTDLPHCRHDCAPQRRAGRCPVATGRPVGVMAARGGVGASCLAASLAAESARTRPTALVDLDLGGGGLDVLLGIEDDGGPGRR